MRVRVRSVVVPEAAFDLGLQRAIDEFVAEVESGPAAARVVGVQVIQGSTNYEDIMVTIVLSTTSGPAERRDA